VYTTAITITSSTFRGGEWVDPVCDSLQFNSGTFTIDPVQIGLTMTFKSMYVNGAMTVYKPIVLASTQSIDVDNGGVLYLDHDGHQGSGPNSWDQYAPSEIGQLLNDVTVLVDGKFYAGYLKLRAKSLTVGGTMTFDTANMDTHITTISVSGIVTSRREWRNPFGEDKSSKASTLTVSNGGTMKLDDIGHASGTWTATSYLNFGSMTIAGTLNGGLLASLSFSALTVDGVFTMDPETVAQVFTAVSIQVKGTWRVDRPIIMPTTQSLKV
jgi:hypothetical protein